MGEVGLLGGFCDFGVDDNEADTKVATGEEFAEKNGSSSESWASDFSRAVTICQKHLDNQIVEQ